MQQVPPVPMPAPGRSQSLGFRTPRPDPTYYQPGHRHRIPNRASHNAAEIASSTVLEALRAPDDSTCADHLPSRLVRSATPLAARTRQVRLRSCSAHGRRVLHEQSGVVLQGWHAKGRDWWWWEGPPLLWGVAHTFCSLLLSRLRTALFLQCSGRI